MGVYIKGVYQTFFIAKDVGIVVPITLLYNLLDISLVYSH